MIYKEVLFPQDHVGLVYEDNLKLISCKTGRKIEFVPMLESDFRSFLPLTSRNHHAATKETKTFPQTYPFGPRHVVPGDSSSDPR